MFSILATWSLCYSFLLSALARSLPISHNPSYLQHNADNSKCHARLLSRSQPHSGKRIARKRTCLHIDKRNMQAQLEKRKSSVKAGF